MPKKTTRMGRPVSQQYDTPLAAAIRRTGMSVAAFAKAHNLPHSTVYAHAAGDKAPQLEYAALYAELLGAPITKLFPVKKRSRK